MSLVIFSETSHEVNHIFNQNHVEAKPLEPVLSDFAWINGG